MMKSSKRWVSTAWNGKEMRVSRGFPNTLSRSPGNDAMFARML